MEEAKKFAIEFIKKNPEHKEEVIDLLQLMADEIEDPEVSEQNEYELFCGACEDLLL